MTLGNSLETVKNHTSNRYYDLIHIDGGHEDDVLNGDIDHCKKFADSDTIVIIDDISFHPDHFVEHMTRITVDRLMNGEIVLLTPKYYSNYHVVVKYTKF
jgi:predicted O-methyltransferase YrrM